MISSNLIKIYCSKNVTFYSIVKVCVICRQKTDMDKWCVKKKGESAPPVGSRLYCDCDILMKKVMQHILPADKLKEWEDNRPERMKEYDLKRQ